MTISYYNNKLLLIKLKYGRKGLRFQLKLRRNKARESLAKITQPLCVPSKNLVRLNNNISTCLLSIYTVCHLFRTELTLFRAILPFLCMAFSETRISYSKSELIGILPGLLLKKVKAFSSISREGFRLILSPIFVITE